MDAVISQTRSVHGALSLPADKAICHRAALLCALSHGSTEISPWSSAEDCQQTLAILKSLGVNTVQTPQGVRIQGVGLTGFRAPTVDLYCGNSGTTMRLAAGLLAGQPFRSRLTAGASLSSRPMRRIVEPLSRMGARLDGRRAVAPHASADLYPPLEIDGQRPLRGITYSLPVPSAQVKSALLFAGLYAQDSTTVLEAVPTRDHTERLLMKLGVPVRRITGGITLEPPERAFAAPQRLVVPGDLSSAAFFVAAAAVLPGSHVTIRDVGLNPTRRQFLEVLQRMGASIRWDIEENGWEPRGTVTVEHRPLHGIHIAAHEVPALIDELPALMVAACAAEGSTRVEGLEELRVKETDRLRAMTTGLARLGAAIECPEPAVVQIARSRLRGATVESFGDHRTAMSLAVAGLLADGDTTVTGAECVKKSLGNFFQLLSSIAGTASIKTG